MNDGSENQRVRQRLETRNRLFVLAIEEFQQQGVDKARIRDIVEMNDGRILLWADPDVITIERAEAEVMGKKRYAFNRHCGGCHVLKDGATHGVGPDLKGIVGSSAASAPGFSYSPAMRDSNIRWTPEALDRFIAAPHHVVPGTSMSASGLSNAELRAAIIRYLE